MQRVEPELEARILEFFNQATRAEELARQIRDDPRVRKAPPSARGLGPSLAAHLLHVRDSRYGGRFTSLEQIDGVPGVGPDTLQDILYSFGGPAPLEVRFRQGEDPRWAERILDFVNGVTDPLEIVAKVRDDPDYGGRSSRAYGIRPSLARRIIAARDGQPGGRFVSVDQIQSVRGVGPDTFHDLLYTFHRVTAEFVGTWGSLGEGTRQFHSPMGIAVDPAGNVYVADTNNHRIRKFGP